MDRLEALFDQSKRQSAPQKVNPQRFKGVCSEPAKPEPASITIHQEFKLTFPSEVNLVIVQQSILVPAVRIGFQQGIATRPAKEAFSCVEQIYIGIAHRNTFC